MLSFFVWPRLIKPMAFGRHFGSRKVTVMAASLPVTLHGLHKVWSLNDELKEHCKANGLKALIQTFHPKQAIAKKDVWHAVRNRDTVQPIIFFMRRGGLLKTPYLDDLEYEIAAFGVLIQGKQIDADTLGQIKQDQEVDLHCVATSIKKILSFLRSKFLRNNTPRDRGWEEDMHQTFLLYVCLSISYRPRRVKTINNNDQKNVVICGIQVCLYMVWTSIRCLQDHDLRDLLFGYGDKDTFLHTRVAHVTAVKPLFLSSSNKNFENRSILLLSHAK